MCNPHAGRTAREERRGGRGKMIMINIRIGY